MVLHFEFSSYWIYKHVLFSHYLTFCWPALFYLRKIINKILTLYDLLFVLGIKLKTNSNLFKSSLLLHLSLSSDSALYPISQPELS